MEKTLIVLKPDAVMRGLVGEVLSRFEKAGLKIVAVKMIEPNEEHYFKHYEEIGQMVSRRGEDQYKANLKFMLMGPVIAIVLEGIGAVETVRKMVGDTEPKSAQPGSIRGDYAHMSFEHANGLNVGIPNLVHASGSISDAKQEIAHWFSDSELHNYQTVHEQFTQKKKSK